MSSPTSAKHHDAFLHELLDYRMLQCPNDPYLIFSLPEAERPTELTFLEFGRAAHRFAHHIRPDPSEGNDNQLIAIIANIDSVVYHALTMGIMRAGYTPFPMSHRNAPAGVISMLAKSNCHRILTTAPSVNELTDSLISAVKEEIPADFDLRIDYVPPFGAIYPRFGQETIHDPFKAYPPKIRPGDDFAICLHSSGSTGFPKPIPQTLHFHRLAGNMSATLDYLRMSPPLRKIGIFGLPPFHAYGFNVEVHLGLYTGMSVCVFPPTIISKLPSSGIIPLDSYPYTLPMVPTSDNIYEHSKKTSPEALTTVPTFVDAWATENDDEIMAHLRSLRQLTFGGGPLTFEKGQFLVSKGVKLRSAYGGTEIVPPSHVHVPEDPNSKYWNYVKFCDRVNTDWSLQGSTDNQDSSSKIYELRVLPSDVYGIAVSNFREEVQVDGKTIIKEGYAASDLFQKHPILDLWKIVGRIDDVIILSSGEKTVPAPIEEAIAADSLVKSAVMFGRERDQVGVLIEPAVEVGPGEEEKFIDRIWPTVEAATASSPAFSRIFKEMILLINKDKPMLKTDKGTLKKKAMTALYEQEINALYEEAGKRVSTVPPPKSWSKEDIQDWLAVRAADVVTAGRSTKVFKVDGDLFEQGFDSLSATFLRNQIVAALRTSDLAVAGDHDHVFKAVPQNLVFSYPTLNSLASHIARLRSVSPNGSANSSASFVEQRAYNIENLISRFSHGLSGTRQTGELILPSVILLTGTTGNLGSFLLASLLRDERVCKVYAYNRPGKKTSKERQIGAFVDRGLPLELLDSEKLVFLEGISSNKKLGLESSQYEHVLSSVTAIIHNAWRLDFNLSVDSFEPHIAGTRNLIDLALSSPNAAYLRFMFTSSIGAAQSWPKDKGPFPEELQLDGRYAVGSGYGEGKYICERILANSGLQATSFRIGQITGPVPSGSWATSDWVSILVKSSVALGVLPNAHGTISWLPVTAVSDAILDTLFMSGFPPQSLNIAHPRPIEWTKIMTATRDALSEAIGISSLPIIPFTEWFEKLENAASNANEESMSNLPALKLLGFFRSFSEGQSQGDSDSAETILATEKMRRLSNSFRMLEPLSDKDVKAWICYWKKKGMLG